MSLRSEISYYWHRYIKWTVRVISLVKMTLILSPMASAMITGDDWGQMIAYEGLDYWETMTWIILFLFTFIT